MWEPAFEMPTPLITASVFIAAQDPTAILSREHWRAPAAPEWYQSQLFSATFLAGVILRLRHVQAGHHALRDQLAKVLS